MSNFHVEPMNGGLVTSRPPVLLTEGELVAAPGVYRPFSQSLWSPPANATFGTPSGTVSGLRYCGFDYRKVACQITSANTGITTTGSDTFANITVGASVRGTGIPANTTVASLGTTTATLSAAATLSAGQTLTFDASHLVLVQQAATFSTAVATNASGTFSPVSINGITTTAAVSISPGVNLDSVAYNNNHVLLNGIERNYVLKADGTARPHGMAPVVTSPTLVTGSGTWALDSGIGYYAYWTTEYDKVNDIESDFQGKPAVVNVSTTSIKVTVTRPPRVNISATHWRVYRSTKMEASTTEEADKESIFPSGNRVYEVTMNDDGTNMTFVDGGGATSDTARAWTATGIIGKSTNGVTWVVTGTSTATLTGPASEPVAIDLANFNIPTGTVTAPITGIQVVVTGSGTNGATAQMCLRSTRSLYSGIESNWKTIPLTSTPTAYTLGSSTDTWFYGYNGNTDPAKLPQWDPLDFANGKFVVHILGSAAATQVVTITTVTVSVTYGKSDQTADVTPFPAITITAAGLESAPCGWWGQPPIATTGDIFQDSLCLNDVTVGNFLRYSYQTKIDAFPTLYYINFNTQEQDVITCIKAVGNALVVGMNGRKWRVTYLPRETDASYDRGRCVELLSSEKGIVGTLAACRFTHPEGRQMLASFSGNSFDMTDAYVEKPVTNDIDFRNLVEPTYLNITEVVNNPDLHELLLLYVPKGTSTKNGVLRFSYHPTHIKQDGSLKCSAGAMGTTRATTMGVLRTGVRVFYTTDGTNVFRANQTPTSTVVVAGTTRQFCPPGIGKAIKVLQMFTHYTQWGYSAASGGTITHALRGHRANKAAAAVDADYTRIDSNHTTALLAYPTGSSTNPRDSHILKTAVNFGDSIVSDAITLNSTAGCHYSLDFNIFEYEELSDEFTSG
jgi:hypothetical protein